MATFTDTIRFVVEASTGAAERGLKAVRGELSQAEGATGKLRAASGKLGGFLKDNIALGVAGAGAAVTAFAQKAIGEFQSLARSADKFAAASGLAVEDASRWIEVAGDIGVEVGTIEGAVNKLNIAASKGKLKELGIDTADANERLLQVIDHLAGLSDETERARLAQELLGKSWVELAPLIDASDTLRANLADVSKAKVITPEEAEQAKKFRDTMDELNGIIEDLTINIGDDLVRSLNQLAPPLKTVFDWLSAINEQIDRLPAPVRGTILGFARGGPIGAAVGGGSGLVDAVFGTGPESNAKVAPPGTPGIGVAPSTVNVTVNNPPSTDGRETDRSLTEYWRRNGGAP